jgi:hypothetical protein
MRRGPLTRATSVTDGVANNYWLFQPLLHGRGLHPEFESQYVTSLADKTIVSIDSRCYRRSFEYDEHTRIDDEVCFGPNGELTRYEQEGDPGWKFEATSIGDN